MTSFELFGFLVIAVVSFGISYIGAAVGLVLGHFRVVLITYVLGSAVAGTATSMAISTVSTVSGAVAHARAGRVELTPILLVGLPSAVTAYAAARFAQRVDPQVLKLAIACSLLVAAVDMMRKRHAKPNRDPSLPRVESIPPSPIVAGAFQVLIGAVLGTISGFVGLLLGSLRLPAMMRVGVSPATAIGTNMTIGAITGLSAGLSAFAVGRVDFRAFAVIAPLALLGSHFGAQKTGHLDAATLRKWIAAALAVTALGMFADLGWSAWSARH